MLALRNPLRRQVISKGLTGMLCAFAWAFSFIILIPITFEVNLFGLDWGKFGFNPLHALCNTYSCKTECLGFSSSAFIYTIAFFVPCFLILLAYLVMVPISLYKYIKQSSLLTQLNQGKISKLIRKLFFKLFSPLIFQNLCHITTMILAEILCIINSGFASSL